jgi:hypothetical protein
MLVFLVMKKEINFMEQIIEKKFPHFTEQEDSLCLLLSVTVSRLEPVYSRPTT